MHSINSNKKGNEVKLPLKGWKIAQILKEDNNFKGKCNQSGANMPQRNQTFCLFFMIPFQALFRFPTVDNGRNKLALQWGPRIFSFYGQMMALQTVYKLSSYGNA